MLYRRLDGINKIAKEFRKLKGDMEEFEITKNQWLKTIMRNKPYSYYTTESGKQIILSVGLKCGRQLDIPIYFKNFQKIMPRVLETIQLFKETVSKSKVKVLISNSRPENFGLTTELLKSMLIDLQPCKIDFNIEILNCTSCIPLSLGDYTYITHTIRIFFPSCSTEEDLLDTVIHEYAHHLVLEKQCFGELKGKITMHGKEFFNCYDSLIKIATSKGVFKNNNRSRSHCYTTNAQYDEAIKNCTEAIRLFPDDAYYYANRGDCYFNKEQYDEAIKDNTNAIKLDFHNDSYYNNRGNCYNAKEQYAKAIKDYTEAISLDSNKAAYYANRGDCYFNKEQYDEAIKDYTEAIRQNPNEAAYYSNRGHCYSAKEQYVKVIKDYTEAIRLNPNNDFFYLDRGRIYYKKGQYDEAIKDYTKAIKLNPYNAYYYSKRGICYYEKKQYDEAIKNYTELIRLTPNEHCYSLRGYCYYEKKQYDEAIKDYTEAIRLNPKEACFYNGRANSYYKKGQYGEAIKDNIEAIRLNPKEACFYGDRANSYYKKGQYDEAIKDYTEAIVLNPRKLYLRRMAKIQICKFMKYIFDEKTCNNFMQSIIRRKQNG